jgi:hypothetical protein
MAAKLTRLVHSIAIQLHLVAESLPFAVLAPGGQSGNFLIHPRNKSNDVVECRSLDASRVSDSHRRDKMWIKVLSIVFHASASILRTPVFKRNGVNRIKSHYLLRIKFRIHLLCIKLGCIVGCPVLLELIVLCNQIFLHTFFLLFSVFLLSKWPCHAYTLLQSSSGGVGGVVSPPPVTVRHDLCIALGHLALSCSDAAQWYGSTEYDPPGAQKDRYRLLYLSSHTLNKNGDWMLSKRHRLFGVDFVQTLIDYMQEVKGTGKETVVIY